MIHDYREDFELTPGEEWLNTASEGPLPKVAAAALAEALRWKMSPQLLTIPKFNEVPLLLKQSLAGLINASAQDIILGNSATYGMHLLSQGLGLSDGDEVILMRNDFPTDILPWLHLQGRGVKVTQLPPRGPVLTPPEVLAAINVRTKVVCLPMVHSFSGWALDIPCIGRICRERDIVFIVNMSQVLGNTPVDLSVLPVDAFVCAGYKWLLGPYGTGFCWITPVVRRRLTYHQAYWTVLLDEQTLNASDELVLNQKEGSRNFDVFATANFFNFVPWRASVDYLRGIGVEVIARHARKLIDQIHDHLDKRCYEILSPAVSSQRTAIMVLSHHDRARNKTIFDALKEQGIHAGFWKGNIRVSAHLYNTQSGMDRLVDTLNKSGAKP